MTTMRRDQDDREAEEGGGMTEPEDAFREWWARNYPWDWLTKEVGVDYSARIRVWGLCRAAFLREDVIEEVRSINRSTEKP